MRRLVFVRRLQYLQRQPPLERGVVGQEHCSHSALAEVAHHPVLPQRGAPPPAREVCSRTLPPQDPASLSRTKSRLVHAPPEGTRFRAARLNRRRRLRRETRPARPDHARKLHGTEFRSAASAQRSSLGSFFFSSHCSHALTSVGKLMLYQLRYSCSISTRCRDARDRADAEVSSGRHVVHSAAGGWHARLEASRQALGVVHRPGR